MDRKRASLEGESGVKFVFMPHDVREPLDLGGFDVIYHLACPASPVAYQSDPIGTTETAVIGTRNMLDLATDCNARIVIASTSEVYGDPEKHPQTENYRGNVCCNSIRSCYDEGKRCGESLAFDYYRMKGTNVGVARIFNTYGPRLAKDDGRVISNFIVQALCGEPLTIYGDGSQTRSFCYVSDTVRGLMALGGCSFMGPVNIGNPDECTMIDIAETINRLTGNTVGIIHKDLPADDPTRRCPDISLAHKWLDWSPTVPLQDGLESTIRYFRKVLHMEVEE
jgi:UDP-glucuronate decarboxylase